MATADSTEELLRGLARSVEAELAARLHGFFGSMIRAYLPQAWEFRTEDGPCVLVVERDGTATVRAGAAPQPDVTVEIPRELLRTALLRRTPGSVPAGAVKVTAHTSKGRTAFGALRSRFNL